MKGQIEKALHNMLGHKHEHKLVRNSRELNNLRIRLNSIDMMKHKSETEKESMRREIQEKIKEIQG